jgi:hypothetical protein
MPSAEMLVLLGGGAVLPLCWEALWSWAKAKRSTRAVRQSRG